MMFQTKEQHLNMAKYINIGVEKLKDKNLISKDVYVKFIKK